MFSGIIFIAVDITLNLLVRMLASWHKWTSSSQVEVIGGEPQANAIHDCLSENFRDFDAANTADAGLDMKAMADIDKRRNISCCALPGASSRLPPGQLTLEGRSS